MIPHRRPGHIIAIFFVLLLLGIVYWAFFLKEEPVPLIIPTIIILLIIVVIGAAVLFFAVRMAVSPPPLISINRDGFEYNASGISTRFIPWTDVAEIKDVEVRTYRGNVPGPYMEMTLAVKLNSPDAYQRRHNSFVRGAMKTQRSLYDADIFFRLSDFGEQAEEVKEMMRRNWERAGLRG